MSLRSDRFVSISLVDPVRRLVPSRRVLPVLMYHGITDESEPDRGPYFKLNTPPRTFAQQMKLLGDLGYQGLDLEAALPRFQRNPSERLVAITFDDGFRNFYSNAFPILKRCGFTSTMYLPTEYIGDQRKSFKGSECLTWDEVRELRREGMRFASHTVTHPRLYELPWENIQQELICSKKRIDSELGENTVGFAYPYGFPEADSSFISKFQEILQRTGFQHCVTTRIGRVTIGDSPFTLRRLPVNSCDDDVFLRAKLNGSYDWLAFPQYWSKRLRGSRRSS